MNRIAVLGLGLFGTELARTLVARGGDVVAVDREIDRIEAMKSVVARAIRLDATDPAALEEHGIHQSDVAIVCFGRDFEAAELATVALRELGTKHVITRGTTRDRVRILEALGPDRVVAPNVDAARRLALTLTTPHVRDVVELESGLGAALRRIGKGEDGRTLQKLRLRGVHVAALLREGLEDEGAPAGVRYAPEPETVLRRNDRLVIFGPEEKLLQ